MVAYSFNVKIDDGCTVVGLFLIIWVPSTYLHLLNGNYHFISFFVFQKKFWYPFKGRTHTDVHMKGLGILEYNFYAFCLPADGFNRKAK